ncbi:MAG: hypothetical protein ABJH72_06040 [Reichenbachiella sp.]|uniref:hypothetical protein n=1 Tax=Reichenbachiella sp. TaxID=2184521 RepID=UPI0032992691
MEFNPKIIYIFIALFGLSIIIDSVFFNRWETVYVEKVYGDDINGSRRGGGEYVTKVDLGFKTIVVDPRFASHLRKLERLEISSTVIFNQVTAIKIPIDTRYIHVPLKYGIKNGYYIFPLTLIITSILAFTTKSDKVRAYSFATTAIVGLFVLYILFLN